jgi:lipopolysaccharide/colanic/teichoic acid biosynthesis glycosyltransferase
MGKRLMDIFLSLFFLLAGLPLWLVLLFLQLFLSNGLFFRQIRLGLNHVPFTIIKLKSMKNGAGQDVQRVTRWGKLLRATRLDEFPQLFLVLSGTMSIVGPRPLIQEYFNEYDDVQKLRHKVKPGITGLAQINGANDLEWTKQFELDVEYAQKVNMLLDLSILLKSPFFIFKRSLTTGRIPYKSTKTR